MDSSVVWAVLAGVVVIAILVASVTAVLRSRKLKGQLSDDELRHHDACKAADKAVRSAEADHARLVKDRKAALKKVQNPEKLAQMDRLNYVTPVTVCVGGKNHPLTPDVSAALDEKGDVQSHVTQRSTVTRVVTGGALAGPLGAVAGGAVKKTKHHKVDTRELYLMVLADQWQEVAKLDPQKGDKARALMQSINVAARNSEEAKVRHLIAVEEAQRALDEAVADTNAIEAAKAARQALGVDPLERLKSAGKDGGATTGTPAPGVARFEVAKPDQNGPQDVVR